MNNVGEKQGRGQRAARQGQQLGGAQPEASPHLSSWKELDVAEGKSKMKKNNLFPFPIQEIAKGIYISWGDLEYKL